MTAFSSTLLMSILMIFILHSLKTSSLAHVRCLPIGDVRSSSFLNSRLQLHPIMDGNLNEWACVLTECISASFHSCLLIAYVLTSLSFEQKSTPSHGAPTGSALSETSRSARVQPWDCGRAVQNATSWFVLFVVVIHDGPGALQRASAGP